MCKHINLAVKETIATAKYRKDNMPDDMIFEVLARPCLCGKGWFARVANGSMWVDATEERGNS